MKKILSLLLILVMVFSLSACGAKTVPVTEKTADGTSEQAANPDQIANPDQTVEPVEISIFQFKVEIVEALNHAIALYEDEHPNVKINLQTVGGGDDYGAALRAQFQSGNEPDIYDVGGPQDVKDWMDKLEDLTDAPWAGLPLDGVLSGVTVEGKVYALPYNIEGYGLAYNKAIFEASGVDATTLTTFDALEEALQIIQTKIDSGALKEQFPLLEAPVEYAAKETWVTGLHASNIAFASEFAGAIETFDAASIEFKHADALKAYIDLMAKYSSNAAKPSGLNAVDYSTQVDEGIAIERVAVIQQGNWIYGGVKAIDENVANNLGFLPIPLKGVKEDSIAIGVPMYWAINKDSEAAKKATAKDFLNWLYTSEEGKKIVVNEMFFIPPMSGYDNVQPADPLAQDILRFASEGKTMPWVFMGYPTDWGQSVLGEQIQKYYAGETTWEELIQTAKDKWVEMR
ncbi:ABC transporter substrate-binding protein [Fusibacter sp. 3D3]|uniref:ABC transporter substrate-binding protein n=1 Tax=Fusibacter sp. 3D3 TaxID=1048380 RepID=UPI000855F6B0|nr:ABC transporter substrate-binding protein [Fusibacter sp. 3D3]GAU76792.1 multiple sugar ABC transporter substrate-binding protein [Fusibacter sp. 3D3]